MIWSCWTNVIRLNDSVCVFELNKHFKCTANRRQIHMTNNNYLLSGSNKGTPKNPPLGYQNIECVLNDSPRAREAIIENSDFLWLIFATIRSQQVSFQEECFISHDNVTGYHIRSWQFTVVRHLQRAIHQLLTQFTVRERSPITLLPIRADIHCCEAVTSVH